MVLIVCCSRLSFLLFFFFFNDTATTEIYTLSLHDALPLPVPGEPSPRWPGYAAFERGRIAARSRGSCHRSGDRNGFALDGRARSARASLATGELPLARHRWR